MSIHEIKNKLLNGGPSLEMKSKIMTIGKNKKKPLGKFNPWAWWGEITRGCNLRCGFCATRLFPQGKYEFMSIDAWTKMINIIKEVSPNTRLEIGNAGEPTLNPNIYKMLSIAKEICPTIQLMIYTNGTTLINRETTYKRLFDAGLNMIQVNMYAPEKEHIRLADDSGYFYYLQADKPKDFPGIFTYQKDTNFKAIRLEYNPGNWISRKRNSGKMSTFFNNLDWEEAKKHGIYPVSRPPERRCDLPFKYVNVYFDGSYTFCCFDFMRNVAGKLGNVSDGADGFFEFWFGEYMQDVRKKVYNKKRISHEYCSSCAFTSIRCDIGYWDDSVLNEYWNGESWIKNK